MAALLFIVFVGVPILELYVIVRVADAIGVLETVGLVILVALVGTWVVKQQGLVAWTRFRRALAEGRVPGEEIVDGVLIVFGGALLLTPGFVTDALGLVMLVPPTRAVVKKLGRRGLRRSVRKRSSAWRVYDARVVSSEREVNRPTTPPASDPSGERPGALEDGSPDRE